MPDFNFLTTHVGSVPHTTASGLTDKLAAVLDIPAWPQLPRRSFCESMYVQYSPTLPSVEVNEEKQKIILKISLLLKILCGCSSFTGILCTNCIKK